MYFIIHGIVQIRLNKAEADTVILCDHDFFGESGMINPSATKAAKSTATARTYCAVVALTHEAFN